MKRIAIGCQGGGMHAAFEVGVLTKILEASAKPDAKFKLVGLSGTSAGALCALMAWYGLVHKKTGRGSADKAIGVLNNFWKEFVAAPGAENILNLLMVGASKIAETEIPVLGVGAGSFSFNPRGAIYRAVAACLPNLGVRRKYFDLDFLLNETCPDFEAILWDDEDIPRLLIGASEAINGYETVFDSDLNKSNAAQIPVDRWRQRLRLSLAGVAASGTLPSVREAQHIEGCGSYWDGLYSQNPPIREFVEDRSKEKAADEIWILRINPQQWPRLPETLGEVRDRENELMGNLSLHKDLDYIQKVNKLSQEIKKIKEGYETLLRSGQNDNYFKSIGAALEAVKPFLDKEVVVRTIKMRKTTCDELQYSSKFNRSLDVLNRLRDEGQEVGEEWLRGWPDHVDCYPADAGYATHRRSGG